MSERKRPSLGAPKLDDRPEVDLYGRTYTIRPVTRSVEIKLAEFEARIEGAEGRDAEFAAIADQLDVLLAPVDGQRTPASKVLLEKWESELLLSADLVGFLQEVYELAAERPT